MPELNDHLAQVEWYDNHRIETILACKRKAFWHLVGPPVLTNAPDSDAFKPAGLDQKVGTGAHFGTCAHAAHEVYRQRWQLGDEFERRWLAFGAFEREWHRLFPNGPDSTAHVLERGIAIIDAYFERFEREQALYRPVDPECAFAIEIRPRKGEPIFDPFWFAGRIDGIDERLVDQSLLVDELKTTSSGAARRLRSLGRSRQPKGYVWAAREILAATGRDPSLVKGFQGDVILIAAKKIDFQRDYFPVSVNETESWRRQTIEIVEEWRRRLAIYKRELIGWEPFDDWQSLFYETTEECFKYGECPFLTLCESGPSPANLADFWLDRWSPAGELADDAMTVIAKEQVSAV